MHERILFPTDGSDTAAAAFAYALDVAAEHDATIHVLNVADTGRDSVTQLRGQVLDVLEDEGERIVQEAADRAADRGVEVVPEVLQGDPHQTITDYADRHDVDLVVMATHGRRGVERFLLGSVTERVINATAVPVLAVSPGEGQALAYPPRNVLVPTDGSEGAGRALAVASDLSAAVGARLHLLHVVDTASLGFDVRSAIDNETLAARAEDVLEAALEQVDEDHRDDVETTVAYGRVYREILNYVEENDVDLVAVGTQGEAEFSRYTMGSVTAKILRTSPVAVLMTGDPDAA